MGGGDRHAEVGRAQEDRRRGGLGGEAVDRLELDDPLPIVFMIRQPPTAVPSDIALAA